MANTLSLNSNDTIMITTFWGGEQGRSYTIHLFIGEHEFKTTLNEEDFFEMVINYNDDVEIEKFISKPEAINRQQSDDPGRSTDWDRDHPAHPQDLAMRNARHPHQLVSPSGMKFCDLHNSCDVVDEVVYKENPYGGPSNKSSERL